MKIETVGIKVSKNKDFAKWISECYGFARKSNHPSTHNAALLVKFGKVILRGTNILPPGVKVLRSRYFGKNKHIYPNHAERDVIFRAAREGLKTHGLTMVMPWLPCVPCANAIISSGIKRLVIHKQMVERTDEKWKAELKSAVLLMKEAGVAVVAYDGVVGVKAYMHHKWWDA